MSPCGMGGVSGVSFVRMRVSLGQGEGGVGVVARVQGAMLIGRGNTEGRSLTG